MAKYPDFARDLIDISLKRWCVETNHWHIDRFFDQDQAALMRTMMQPSAAPSPQVYDVCLHLVPTVASGGVATGVCTTPRALQHACENIKFSALLLESFFKDDAKHLTQDWLSRELKFMKEEEAEDRGILAGSGELRSRALAAPAVHRTAQEAKKAKNGSLGSSRLIRLRFLSGNQAGGGVITSKCQKRRNFHQ